MAYCKSSTFCTKDITLVSKTPGTNAFYEPFVDRSTDGAIREHHSFGSESFTRLETVGQPRPFAP